MEHTGLIYLDYNATAPIRPEALAATLDALHSVGNASSVHHHGRNAAARVDKARRQVSELLSCAPGEIIFTSGATEANNLALRAASAQGGALVTTAVEHPAVLEAARSLSAESSAPLVTLPVSADGIVDLAALEASVQSGEVAVVSVMLANNETGTLADLASVVKIARTAGALVHSDATQYVGRLPVDLDDLDVDLLSLSAHKFGGPQGIGALFVRRGVSLPHRPLLVGGGHEKGWRAGTLNVAGIVGMGAAAEAAHKQLDNEAPRITKLRDLLEGELLAQLPGSHVNGARAPRLPGVTSITFLGAPADAVLASMPDIAASDGSACSAGAPSPSHVLLAMGLSREAADSTIRFSMGYATTEQEIRRAIDATVRAVTHVQTVMGAAAGP
ncbi:cysteine desulfurase [Streptomyces sp. 2333.5]|uniref:cysteine desulfurase family protein n=1 Tax=unclassified Streptomyces TaxID=2593676 RepID=UPI00089BE76D|nr:MULTISPECIES: cysteine desulfurase family protein [unclassified Streptomyces]PJJ04224.1 cysteine desulfurase [Streptomyces sp. 2333.5]SEE71588.1 cysteine desulfurase [Streptomyces sp. 2112.2]